MRDSYFGFAVRAQNVRDHLCRYCAVYNSRCGHVTYLWFIVLTSEAALLHLSQSAVGIPGLATKLDRGHTKRV